MNDNNIDKFETPISPDNAANSLLDGFRADVSKKWQTFIHKLPPSGLLWSIGLAGSTTGVALSNWGLNLHNEILQIAGVAAGTASAGLLGLNVARNITIKPK